MVTSFGIAKCVSYALSLILMITTAVGTEDLYGCTTDRVTIQCGMFRFKVCFGGDCEVGDTYCGAFDNTRKAAGAMWVMAFVCILIGLGHCLAGIFATAENKCIKYRMIAVDVAASLLLFILVVLVAVQPTATWCGSDFSDPSLPFKYGFYLTICTMVLSTAMSCAGFCYSVTPSSYKTIGLDVQQK